MMMSADDRFCFSSNFFQYCKMTTAKSDGRRKCKIAKLSQEKKYNAKDEKSFGLLFANFNLRSCAVFLEFGFNVWNDVSCR